MRLDYGTKVIDIEGKEGTLEEYKGRVLVIVNTASKCGLTPQYKGLEALHKAYGGEGGLSILGFPCNQFMGQEPGTEVEIAAFCELNYGVSFDLFSKINVNGDQTHPLFDQLKKAAPGMLGSTQIKWNFTKFIVAADGEIRSRFAPKALPSQMEEEIKAALASRP